MYKLNEDAIHKIPNFYDNTGLRAIVSLQEAKELFINFMKENYEWSNKIEKNIETVKTMDNIYKINYFMYNSTLKGLKIKTISNYIKRKNQK